jgi:hypothetical protein
MLLRGPVVMGADGFECRIYGTLLNKFQEPCCWAVRLKGFGVLGHVVVTTHTTPHWILDASTPLTDPGAEEKFRFQR